MRLTKEFIDTLKNFSSINDEMLFIPGKKQSVISKGGTIFASITSDVEIETQFAIFGLSKFLSLLSLFEEPEILVKRNLIEIYSSKGTKTVSYQLKNPEFVVYEKNPDKFDKMNEDISFNMKYEDFSSIEKIGLLLGSNDFIFEGDGNTITLKVSNDNDNGSSGSTILDDTKETFKLVVPIINVHLMKEDYQVTISRKGGIRFRGKNIEYFIVADRKKSEL
jgi:hypothetical protein